MIIVTNTDMLLSSLVIISRELNYIMCHDTELTVKQSLPPEGYISLFPHSEEEKMSMKYVRQGAPLQLKVFF